ncbi:cytochrome P450 [Colletotrichum phormii]|uniref:Cytochrome P450 n=1 Tax=Colletotrichum phormii TaxID=359342 RepID=A0AAJ0A012_9PEZI|nr:cytochrome P450 [Colletotrichum phormii]KAK1641338.1 cytochrome P450 [Colletotrichum phormii]
MLQSFSLSEARWSLILVLPVAASSLILAYFLGYAAYQLYLNPLRKFPGPKLWSISSVPYVREFIAGTCHLKILKLHQRHGPIVRVGPNHLSINHPDGMQELRGHRKSYTGENGKDPVNALPNRDNIIGSERGDHSRFRRALAHGFSAQSMLAQQPIIKGYVDTLFEKLRAASRGGEETVNVEKWFNFTTFDVIGDLAFGEPFECLEDSKYHPWVDLIFKSIKNMAMLTSFRRLPWLKPLLMLTLPKELMNKYAQNRELSREKVRKRLELGKSRPDFIDAMIRKSESAGQTMSFEEMTSNAMVLIIAGSETTATLLTAATYFLASNPRVLAKLNDEVRSAFTTEDEIDMLSVQNLPYLLAVLDESLRMFPPVPGPSPRAIGEGGDTILGESIPQDTVVDVWHWSLYHNPDHFALPEEFIPERFLGDPRFANDAKHALQPFSVGPRNCIGKNLAYAEMRLILARLIWNFDIRPAAETPKWYTETKVYILWEKGGLDVYLTPRVLEE